MGQTQAETPKRTVRIWSHSGAFNWLKPEEIHTQVMMSLPDDAPGEHLEETWKEDRAPDVDDKPPSEVVELIAERVAGYWILSDRDKKQALIAWCREHSERLDREWAQALIAKTEATIQGLQKKITSLRETYLYAEGPGQ